MRELAAGELGAGVAGVFGAAGRARRRAAAWWCGRAVRRARLAGTGRAAVAAARGRAQPDPPGAADGQLPAVSAASLAPAARPAGPAGQLR